MKRPAMPTLSVAGQQALDAYADALSIDADASGATVRNYLSDLRQFIAWCETIWAEGQETAATFSPTAITTPLLTRYRAYLQHTAFETCLGEPSAHQHEALCRLGGRNGGVAAQCCSTGQTDTLRTHSAASFGRSRGRSATRGSDG